MPVGKEVDTDSIIDRCWRAGATARIGCRVDGWTPVVVRDKFFKASWVSERKRYATKPSAVRLGVFSKMSSVRGGQGGRYSLGRKRSSLNAFISVTFKACRCGKDPTTLRSIVGSMFSLDSSSTSKFAHNVLFASISRLLSAPPI